MGRQSEHARNAPAPLILRRSDGKNVVARKRPGARPAPTGEPLVEVDFDDAGPDAWREEALCATTDPELFFMDGEGGSSYQTARRLCASCPVREACLDDAMAYEASAAGRRYGMYGGLTPKEREKLAVSAGISPVMSDRQAA